MKYIWKAGQVITGWDGKAIKIAIANNPFDEESPITVKDMTIFAAIMVMANNFPCETLDDSSKKKLLKMALKKSIDTNVIELEPEIFRWLKVATEKIAPKAWQDNANEVFNILIEEVNKED